MFLLVCVILLICPESVTSGAKEGIKVAFETVIPAILPFSVFSSALIYSGQGEKTAGLFLGLFKKLHLNPYGSIAYLTGLLGGYPTGCKIVCDMYSQDMISKKEAEKMLGYVNNGGLVFALNVCGNTYFSDRKSGILLFLVSALSALITGVFLARSCEDNGIEIKRKKLPLMAVLGKSVASGGEVVVSILSAFIVFYALSNAFMLYKVPFLEGIWEMTKGIKYAGMVDSPSLAALFFSFGGVNVLAQSSAIAEKYNLKMKYHITGKVISGILSFLIMYIFTNFPTDLYAAVFCVFVVISMACSWKILKKLLKISLS